MNIKTIQGSIQTAKADTIIVNLFKGATGQAGATGAVNSALNGAINELITQGDIKGELGQTAVLYPRGVIPARRVIVVGLGEQKDFNLEAVREASAVAIKKAQELGAETVATIVHGAGIGKLDAAQASQAVVEGSLLALYSYTAPGKHQNNGQNSIAELTVIEFDPAKLPAVTAGAKAGQAIANSVYLARTLVNKPSNDITPTGLANAAQTMADEVGLRCQILNEADMAAENMNALLSVTQGAEEPAKLIILEHKPADIPADSQPIVLIGKGVTFDTGGYSIKTRTGMPGMKGDMGGAGAVIGAMRAVAQLNLPHHIIALVGAVENVIGPKAYKPNDVFIAKNGVSIEIISTDAEGRMTLADVLCYADKFNPALVIDVATLTGGKSIALGSQMEALFCNNEPLYQALMSASAQTNEPLWRMPLEPAYDRQIKSDVADIKNSGGAKGSAITAARFLSYFVADWPWAHIDIAGSAFYNAGPEHRPRSYMTAGASGIPLRTLVQFLRDWQN